MNSTSEQALVPANVTLSAKQKSTASSKITWMHMLQNEFHWWMFIFRHIIKSIRNTNIPTGYCQSSITISECHSFTFSFRVRTIPAMTSILDTWQWSIPILDTEYYYFSSEAPWSSSLAVVAPSVTGSGSAQRLVTRYRRHCVSNKESDGRGVIRIPRPADALNRPSGATVSFHLYSAADMSIAPLTTQ